MSKFDCAVIGLGAIGSAATYQLARRGARVLGIDRFSPPHNFGSSHGDTRITRAAIGEGLEYSQLALRSNTLWREIEAQTGKTLYVRNGCLSICGPDAVVMHDVDDYFVNIEAAAKRYNIPYRTFNDAAAIRARYPQFNVAPGEHAILDEDGGYLHPEACVAAQLDLATRAGATLARNTQVAAITPGDSGVTIATADGRQFTADRVVIAAGAWLPRFLQAEIAGHFTVTRQVLHWFEIRSNPERFRAENCPVFIWQVPQRNGATTDVYGFPVDGDISQGVKVSHEENGGVTDPDNVNRTVDPEREVAHAYRTYVEPFLPDLGPKCLRTEVCLYTRVDRSRFVIDTDPRSDRIIFASPCSGHGFKHSAALGEALAEQVTLGQAQQVDLAPFKLERLKDFVRPR